MSPHNGLSSWAKKGWRWNLREEKKRQKDLKTFASFLRENDLSGQLIFQSVTSLRFAPNKWPRINRLSFKRWVSKWKHAVMNQWKMNGNPKLLGEEKMLRNASVFICINISTKQWKAKNNTSLENVLPSSLLFWHFAVKLDLVDLFLARLPNWGEDWTLAFFDGKTLQSLELVTSEFVFCSKTGPLIEL